MKHRLAMITIMLLVFWAVLGIRLAAPWYGVQETFRVWIPGAIQNLSQYDYDDIGLMVTRNVTPIDDASRLQFYSHHPPLMVWIPALTTQLMGYSELTIRYVFVTAMMIAACGYYVFVRRLYGARLAFSTMFFFMLTPFISYFQRVPGYSPVALPVIMLFGAILVNWLRKPTRIRLFALLCLSWMAVWTAWAAPIFVAMLGIIAMFLGDRRHRIGVVLMGIVSVVAFIALMLMYESMFVYSWEGLMEAFVWRTSTASEFIDSETFTAWDWVTRNTVHIIAYASVTYVVLVLIGVRKIVQHGDRVSHGMLAGIFAAGMIYLLVFRNASYIHDYYKVYVIPASSIVVAAAWVYRREFRARWMKPLIEILTMLTVLWSVGILVLLHSTGRVPVMDVLVAYINEDVTETEYINVDYQHADHALHGVTEYYTQRKIGGWLQPYEEAAAEAAKQGLPLRYIYCPFGDSQLPQALQDVTGTSLGDGACTAYLID